MLTIAEFVKYMREIAPLDLAADWDNVGLLLGDYQAPVKNVMTCLTLSPDVADEAIEEEADMIITHHPILFRPAKKVTTATPEGTMLLKLARAGIAVYSAHTAYDNTIGGINERLAHELKLGDVEPLREAPPGRSLGEGRMGVLDKRIPLGVFIESVKQVTKAPFVQASGDLDRLIDKVAIACGAGGEFLRDAMRERAHVFVTGELRFHDCLAAKSSGLSLCLPGHFASERLGLEYLADQISREQTGIKAWAARCERDPLTII